MSKPTFLIAGAGIAGLTCALSRARLGHTSHIIEAFDKPAEFGAGIQIPPNAWRILKAIGVEEQLLQAAVMPQSIRLGDAHSGKIVLDMKVNRADDSHFGVIHRAALHMILWDAAQKSPAITITTGARLEEVEETAQGVCVICKTSDENEIRLEGHALIGADGIWSNTRRFVPGVTMPKATGRVALRAMVPAPHAHTVPVVTAWMAHKSHIVAYPIRDTDTLSIVAIINGKAHQARWDEKLDGPLPAGLETTLKQITPVDSADIAFTRWPLFSVEPNSIWHSKRICLIGDAAHGMEPFAAQGAAMAIEDAFELATHLDARDNLDTATSFEAFYQHRAPRVAKVAKRTAFNRFAYHQYGPGRWTRNLVFGAQPPEKFMQSLAWLYDYRAMRL